jgi:hypothetical protein
MTDAALCSLSAPRQLATKLLSVFELQLQQGVGLCGL